MSEGTIHIVNTFHNAAGGTEWYAFNLAAALSRQSQPVQLWAEGDSLDPSFARHRGIRPIRPPRRGNWLGRDADEGDFPRGGHLVLLGEWWLPGSWLEVSHPRRITQICTIVWEHDHRPHRRALQTLGCPVDYVFVCDDQKRFYGTSGVVHAVPINIEHFRPRQGGPRSSFVIGRLSRDVIEKHDFINDPPLYRSLLDRGASIRLMGAECIRPLLPEHPRLTVMPPRTEPANAFLHSLDCFFFRTGHWYDTYATVIFEAMATGLPVVAHRWGGYTQYIRDGVDGFLFDTQDEALDILGHLQADPDLRHRMGQQARARIEALYSPSAERERMQHFLSAGADCP